MNAIQADYSDTLLGADTLYSGGGTVGGSFHLAFTSGNDSFSASGTAVDDAGLYLVGNTLMSATESAEFAFTGIPFAHYAIYVYMGYPSAANRGGLISLDGGPTYYQKGGTDATTADKYVQITSTYYDAGDIANSGSAGNYVLFNNLSGSSQTVTCTPLNMGSTTLRVKPVGIQIVEIVPEPATIGMLGLGAFIAILFRRIRM